MNKSQVTKEMNRLQKIINSDDCKAYFNVLIKQDKENNYGIRAMKLNESIAKSIGNKIKKSLNELIKEFNAKDNNVCDFWDSKLQTNGLYTMEEKDMPDIIKKSIKKICDDPDYYSNANFNDIKCVVTKFKCNHDADKNVVCFKVVYPISLVTHKNRITFERNELVAVNKKEFVYRDDIDFLVYNNRIYITDINKFIKLCNLKELHIKKALTTFKSIKTKYPYIEFSSKKFNDDTMEKRFQKIAIAKKVIEVEKNINENTYQNFFQKKLNNTDSNLLLYDDYVNLRIKNNKLIIETYKDFEQLLQIFNDEILISDITDNIYETKNKAKLNKAIHKK